MYRRRIIESYGRAVTQFLWLPPVPFFSLLMDSGAAVDLKGSIFAGVN